MHIIQRIKRFIHIPQISPPEGGNCGHAQPTIGCGCPPRGGIIQKIKRSHNILILFNCKRENKKIVTNSIDLNQSLYYIYEALYEEQDSNLQCTKALCPKHSLSTNCSILVLFIAQYFYTQYAIHYILLKSLY